MATATGALAHAWQNCYTASLVLSQSSKAGATGKPGLTLPALRLQDFTEHSLPLSFPITSIQLVSRKVPPLTKAINQYHGPRHATHVVMCGPCTQSTGSPCTARMLAPLVQQNAALPAVAPAHSSSPNLPGLSLVPHSGMHYHAGSACISMSAVTGHTIAQQSQGCQRPLLNAGLQGYKDPFLVRYNIPFKGVPAPVDIPYIGTMGPGLDAPPQVGFRVQS